jgi:hypothetical protein
LQNLLFLQQSLCWNGFKEKVVRGLEKDAENKGERILWTLGATIASCMWNKVII